MREKERFQFTLRNGPLGILTEIGFVAGLFALGAAVSFLAARGGP